MKKKEFNKNMSELNQAAEALLKIEEVVSKLESAAEAIAQLQAMRDALIEAQNKAKRV